MATTKKPAPAAAKKPAAATAAKPGTATPAGAMSAPAPRSAAPKSAAPIAPLTEQGAGDAAADNLSRRDASYDEIARRAYELWRARGGGHGEDQADWHRAEEELRNGRH